MRRVVVTGIGVTSPIGESLQEVAAALGDGRSGIRVQEAWRSVDGLYTHLGGPANAVLDFDKKQTRTMGRVAQLAVHATIDALADSGLEAEEYRSGRCGISYGSTQGSSEALVDFCTRMIESGGLRGVRPTSYIQFMAHTCAVNLATFFQVTGRIIPTCSACTSGSQGVGYAYESIKFGMQDIMIAGGAEELHYSHAGVFDLLRATSTTFNDAPDRSPRPFDRARDGLVVGEGAATLILEEYERARARGATIYCEIIGYGTTCDGSHMTAPDERGMARAMVAALADAKIAPDDVDYVNAHATATPIGDICESRATHATFGSSIPISSTKGQTGHTLGACGALESVFCIVSLRNNLMPGNRNLEEVDPACAPLDYVLTPRSAAVRTAMNNNFAFGGVNTSLIFRRL